MARGEAVEEAYEEGEEVSSENADSISESGHPSGTNLKSLPTHHTPHGGADRLSRRPTLKARLAKEHPHAWHAYLRGHHRSIRAAAIAAGLIRDTNTPAMRIRRAWASLSPGERTAFLKEIGADLDGKRCTAVTKETITNQRNGRILSLATEGLAPGQIAGRVGLSEASVRRLLRSRGCRGRESGRGSRRRRRGSTRETQTQSQRMENMRPRPQIPRARLREMLAGEEGQEVTASHWRPLGILAVVLGFLLILAGVVTGGPDLVGGIVIGGLAVLAGIVILGRPGRG